MKHHILVSCSNSLFIALNLYSLFRGTEWNCLFKTATMRRTQCRPCLTWRTCYIRARKGFQFVSRAWMDSFVAAQSAQQKLCCTRTHLFMRTRLSVGSLESVSEERICWWLKINAEESHALKESRDRNRYTQISHNIKITDQLGEEHWSWLQCNVENLGSCIRADVFDTSNHPNVSDTVKRLMAAGQCTQKLLRNVSWV